MSSFNRLASSSRIWICAKCYSSNFSHYPFHYSLLYLTVSNSFDPISALDSDYPIFSPDPSSPAFQPKVYSTPTSTSPGYQALNTFFILSEAGLKQMQREPTRGQNLLDLFCCNKPLLVKSITSIPRILDHNIVLTDCELKPSIITKPRRKIYQWHQQLPEVLMKTISNSEHTWKK